MNYKHINNWSGWLVFAISAFVYIITSEPTTSFWDTGEYIATAFKLQVGHPPGAPLFQMLGRFFSLFAFGNEMLVARMVNTMSALASAFTILFLFWTITHLARKIVLAYPETFNNSTAVIIGSGIVGSLAYTFSDSFWFSAVEGEVYAMSSFFTAFVFWAILKWENEADDPRSVRWIILIAFMIGLSIGVHLLNLLTIPAITLVYYFRKYNASTKGVILALGLSVILLGLIMSLIIPWIVKLAGWSELLFVNTLGLPFNTGTIIYFLAIISIIIGGLAYSRRKGKVILNTIILVFTFILIGYSSFFMLVIRANANPPINENEPTHAISLLSYLNREQYGDWPLIYGPYYNAPVVEYEDGKPVYHKNSKTGKYEIINKREGYEPVYHDEFMTLFPRMWSGTEPSHEHYYKIWGGMSGKPVVITNNEGNQETIMKPTFAENLRFFFTYQLQHMYGRYFMWNFAGRQNDIQGLGEDLYGNWISGFNFIDEPRLGPQDNLPSSLENKARNKFYLLPLILGLAGLLFHVNRNPRGSLVIMSLFVMTGIAIVVYLNQYAPQPRERDYAYAASFYAFAIWIGLGVMSLMVLLKKLMNARIAAITATFICLSVPGIMAAQGWDDHDRSNRYTARDIARNYLESCAPNTILFTMGDNDTFPLWYVQDVEGIRTDVRVVNLSLLNSDWYISQMKRKVYDSEPLPISFNYDQFKSGTYDVAYIVPDSRIQGAVSLKELFKVYHEQPDALRLKSSYGLVDILPTNLFSIDVDPAVVTGNGTVTNEEAPYILVNLQWELQGRAITKSQIIVLDILAHNNWERPIYFSATAGQDAYLGLEKYFRNEGFAYRLVPVDIEQEEDATGYINSTILYDKLMNVYKYGNMNDPGVYLDETNVRLINNLRTIFARLAQQLIEEGKTEEAAAVCDMCLATIPDEAVSFNFYLLPIAQSYMEADEEQKGLQLLEKLIDIYSENLDYYFRFPAGKRQLLEQDITQGLMVLNGIVSIADELDEQELKQKATIELDKQFKRYEQSGF